MTKSALTKSALTLAAALLAGSALSTAANAGGIRVGFGFPLGSFVAHSNQSHSYSSGPSYGEKHCAKPAPRRQVAEEAPVHHVKHTAPKHVEVAEEEAPAPRIKKIRAIAKAPVEDAQAEIKTAKLEDKSIMSDAAPAIVIPETPPVVVNNLAGTQSTPSEKTATVTVEPAATPVATTPVKDEPKVETAKIEKIVTIEKDEPKRKVNISSEAKRVCRRFSAAIAGLIDVPCE